MESGTFGRELMGFARGFALLAEDVRALLESEIYKQRLLRVLRNPRNKKALGDFLVLDNLYREFGSLIGGEDAATLWKVREQAFSEVRTAHIGPARLNLNPDDLHLVGERWDLWTRLLHLRFKDSTPGGVWKEMGWK